MSSEKRQCRWDSKELTGSDHNEYQLQILSNQQQRRSSSREPKVAKDSNDLLPPPLPPKKALDKAESEALKLKDIRNLVGQELAITQPLPPIVQLSDLVRRYPNCMPVRVQVRNGYHNSAALLAIAQDEVYDIHFIKHAKVVALRDKCGNEELSLPLNSSVEFAVLYNPKSNEDEARKGFLFKSVAELVASKPLPLVVKATRAYEGSSPESSVEAGELLLLMGVVKSSSFGRGKQLQVRSLTNDGGEKLLHEKCAGAFSTKPDYVRMTLAMMVQHKLTFPQTVLIYPDRELDSFLPSSIASSPVILEGYKGETSIVATQVCSASAASSLGVPSVLDIHLDVEIDVEAVRLDERARVQLAAKTLAIYNSFDASYATVYMKKSMARAYSAQALLYKHTANDLPNGVQLRWPILLGSGLPVAESSHPKLQFDMKSPLDAPQPKRPASQFCIFPSNPPSDSGGYDSILQQPPSKASEDVYQALDFSQVSQEENPYASPIIAPTAGRLTHTPSGTNMSERDSFNYTECFPDASGHMLTGKERCVADLEKTSLDFRSGYLKLLKALDGRIERLELAERDISHTITRLSTVCSQIQERLQRLESRLHQ